MLSLVRSGPKILIIECLEIEKLNEIMSELYDYKIIETSYPREFAEIADENMTVIYTVSKMNDNLKVNDFTQMIIIDEEPLLILQDMYNGLAKQIVHEVRLGPRLLIMKTIGEIDKIVESVANDYDGIVESTETVLENHNGGTVILFTEESINKSLKFESIYSEAVYINAYFSKVIKKLSKHVYKYINKGLEYKDWNTLVVKIYDSYEKYDLHYDRLVYIVEKLGLGVIIGETWGTDAATIFWSVGVYQVKLMTYYSIEEIKKILVGLEYLDSGQRIVDYDLFQKKKKIHWDEIRGKERIGKRELGIRLRNKIKQKLELKDLSELEDLEEKILESRV